MLGIPVRADAFQGRNSIRNPYALIVVKGSVQAKQTRQGVAYYSQRPFITCQFTLRQVDVGSKA